MYSDHKKLNHTWIDEHFLKNNQHMLRISHKMLIHRKSEVKIYHESNTSFLKKYRKKLKAQSMSLNTIKLKISKKESAIERITALIQVKQQISLTLLGLQMFQQFCSLRAMKYLEDNV